MMASLLSTKSVDEGEIGPMLVQRRIVLGFCGTVLVGVLLCTVYLVGRVSRVASSAKAAPPSQAAPAPATQVQVLKTRPAGTESQPKALVSRPGSHPAGDTYLQIAAVDRGMSEVLVELLRRKGFQAETALGPTEDIFRVMVGPAKDAAELARLKTDLQAAGFTSFARKAPKVIANRRQNELDTGMPAGAQ